MKQTITEVDGNTTITDKVKRRSSFSYMKFPKHIQRFPDTDVGGEVEKEPSIDSLLEKEDLGFNKEEDNADIKTKTEGGEEKVDSDDFKYAGSKGDHFGDASVNTINAYRANLTASVEGSFMDDYGNHVNKDGTILKTGQEIAGNISEGKLLNIKDNSGGDGGEELKSAIITNEDGTIDIDIDSEHLKKDNEGNILDDNENIIMSKEDFEAQSESATEDNKDSNALSQIQSMFNVEVLGDDGTPKVYQDNEIGIKQYIDDAVDTQINEAVVQSQEDFLKSNPYLEAYYTHLAKGGNPKSFFEVPITYDKIEIQPNNKEQHTQIIRENLIRKGFEQSRADVWTKQVIDGGNGVEEATAALGELKQADEMEYQAAEQQRQLIETENNAKVLKYWDDIKTTVESGVIGVNDASLNIPREDINGFLNYVSKPVEDGMTQEAIDRMNQTVPQSLLDAYFRFKGGSLNELVKYQTRQNRVIKIKNMAQNSSSYKGRGKTIRVDVKRGDSKGEGIPSLSNLTGS